jgi:hypothetical protein
LAEAGRHVVLHVMELGGGRDRTGDRRVGDGELEEQLPPAVAIDLGSGTLKPDDPLAPLMTKAKQVDLC